MAGLRNQRDYVFHHPIQRWVMPVCLVFGVRSRPYESVQAIGTCFTIAPWLVATAKHLVADYLPTPPDGMAVAVAYFSDDTPSGLKAPWGGIIGVDKVAFDPNHDLAVMRLMPRQIDGYTPTFPALPLSITPPAIDDQVIAFGYPESTVSFPAEDTVAVKQTPLASRGRVLAVTSRRGDAMMDFPVLTAGYPAPGGMSGGPVVSESGHVVGVTSRGTGPNLDDGSWTTWAALMELLPSLGMEVTLLDQTPTIRSMQELIDADVIATDGSYRAMRVRRVNANTFEVAAPDHPEPE